ncbi:hypothetical protein CPB86DRAFT_805868 [Serendipita vermifera]|nr:hypothetical protein CPB86DRAFT_805868 [Serendipita vermifera]
MPRGLDLPIRMRPYFAGLTALVLLFLGLIGFTNIADEWPLNDKLLHFLCMGLATAVFYFVLEVDEEARHILFWRYFGLGFSGIVCILLGGVVSEFIQSLLPYKTFQWGDVAANVLGSSLGLFGAWRLEKYYRARREIARLYQPLGEEEGEDDSEEELLPTHNQSKPTKKSSTPRSDHPRKNNPRLGNVWDSHEDFDIGSASDSGSEEEGERQRRPTVPSTPQIIISESS